MNGWMSASSRSAPSCKSRRTPAASSCASPAPRPAAPRSARSTACARWCTPACARRTIALGRRPKFVEEGGGRSAATDAGSYDVLEDGAAEGSRSPSARAPSCELQRTAGCAARRRRASERRSQCNCAGPARRARRGRRRLPRAAGACACADARRRPPAAARALPTSPRLAATLAASHLSSTTRRSTPARWGATSRRAHPDGGRDHRVRLRRPRATARVRRRRARRPPAVAGGRRHPSR